jgi:alkaline phosphatase D
MAPTTAPWCRSTKTSSFFDGDRRCYVLCKLDHEVLRTELRMVESVSDPDAAEYTFARFVVEDGHPGAQGECVPVNPPPLGRVDC